ncbi:MAG TPA: hypothetical protein VGP48_09955 [Stellaceae bacterium]|jgi:hypothetical protein|nr:hypothetical protein [Stellaceae bacterium]
MATIDIQFSLVRDGKIEMLIADAPDRETAQFWLHFSAPVPTDRSKSLATLQLAALHRLRTELSEQIQAITHNPDLRP